jgi:hypothetical protein
MSATSTPIENTPANANSGCLSRLVRPRPESPKWIELGHHLDSIYGDCNNAIRFGFVQGKTKLLDEKLGKIIRAAEEARRLLRPNND